MINVVSDEFLFYSADYEFGQPSVEQLEGLTCIPWNIICY